MGNSKSGKVFGKNLRTVRTKRTLTQEDVAMKAGITVNYYARIERGEENPSLEVMQSILKALQVKSSEVMPF